jgi:hypothetical protein
LRAEQTWQRHLSRYRGHDSWPCIHSIKEKFSLFHQAALSRFTPEARQVRMRATKLQAIALAVPMLTFEDVAIRLRSGESEPSNDLKPQLMNLVSDNPWRIPRAIAGCWEHWSRFGSAPVSKTRFFLGALKTFASTSKSLRLIPVQNCLPPFNFCQVGVAQRLHGSLPWGPSQSLGESLAGKKT